MPMGLPDTYNLTPQDHQSAFLDNNPQMRPEYNQAMPSWIQQLKRRLAQGGQVMQGAMAPQQSQPQMPSAGNIDPMAQRAQALQSEYNRGSQMAQAGRNVAGLFGFGG